MVSAVAVALAGIAAASLGSGRVAAHDVPVPLLVLAVLVPGVVALVAASRLPQHELRETWDDAAWRRSFRGGLRSHLVPAATARDHVAEIEQTLADGATSARAEFGHPSVLARELAAADQPVRVRRWWVSTIAGAGAPLGLAALVLDNDSWGWLTVPAAVALTLAAATALALGWRGRPWVRSR